MSIDVFKLAEWVTALEARLEQLEARVAELEERPDPRYCEECEMELPNHARKCPRSPRS